MKGKKPQLPSSRPRARLLGPGLAAILEDPRDASRMRVRVTQREGRRVQLVPESETEVLPGFEPGATILLRVARSFGLFCFSAQVAGRDEGGGGWVELSEGPAKRRQMRDYFRMPVRFGVRLEVEREATTMPLLRAVNLSAGGILLLDPNSNLGPHETVRLGLPIGPGGELWRTQARVLRIQEDPRRVALAFLRIHESERVMLLRFILREHRRRRNLRARKDPPSARIVALRERP